MKLTNSWLAHTGRRGKATSADDVAVPQSPQNHPKITCGWSSGRGLKGKYAGPQIWSNPRGDTVTANQGY